ncbi:MAG: zinc ribbon domain-containing protein [Anaerolineae bacterium]
MLPWLVIGLMCVGVGLALGYPLLRPGPYRQTLSGQGDSLDEWVEQVILSRRKQLTGLPTMPTACPRCGQPAQAGDRFCRLCGAALGGHCPQCGAFCEAEDRFCAQCGALLSAREAS